ncbi:hypothetical protein EHF33_14320 [Deinococcus psychrotolerans]|uniref:Uncharacterized protein n=1 Tax=Deinococcus psychrotolerans TaxID=2489213 RepID=A0A3G8YIK2_9DEIO|nr:hypothetical protein [Deinococcus psychrotolerans]AZI44087.1 hypothetical protein EHF33_14320 [Deinococcus psychrotolerans]
MNSINIGEVRKFDEQCGEIMLALANLDDARELQEIVDQFAESDNIYLLRGLSGKFADSEASSEINSLAFPMINHLKYLDFNTLSNLMTAISRLYQKDVSWKSSENLNTAKKLVEMCKRVGGVLKEDAEDFHNLYLS